MEPEVGNIVQWKTRRVANELITGLKCMPNILAIILVTANLWSKANNIPKQDVQDFIDRCKRIRKQDAYTHRGNTKQPVVLSERINAPRQLKDDIQVLLGKKVAHLEKLIEKYVK
ncbi:hypothetical protein DAPPUDRAFT_325621 [Daphnia pulex]|uniref:Uncharacterized protein n=1 Tax=Daphnia pulex TaxID=6669 RepID=E9H5A7_DAPPU|nr:hypothetical protein DAPPUDRAFT_325621 [Daphnia pulex]|eukprot:EFX73097.1 hypothetical protein DAPPUDRAFT_325621 [Daphnia pulex]